MLSYVAICDLEPATLEGKQKMGIISDTIRRDHGCKVAGMSLESSRSLSRTPPPRKRSYPLKMETIPMSSSYEEFKGAHTHNDERLTSGKETEYGGIKPGMSSFEADDDFKFKRHKNKQSNGVPSLGERLDNLQDIKKARWVDNFNSSMPNGREAVPNGGSSPDARTQDHSQPYSQGVQGSGGLKGAPYMPYMYYYPIPTQGAPMVPFVGSPVHPAQMEGGHYMNSSHSAMPNSSLQPFFPPLPQQPRYENGSSQLLPPATFYPYNMVQSQHAQRTKDRRKSVLDNRGRRLSLLAVQDDQHGIVSPHKSVPERDFHRHIGNTSFGKELQLRQLFNWCIIRALRKLEEKESSSQRTSGNAGDRYVDPSKIALSILKEFVSDLRKGAIEVDWEAEEEASGDDEPAAAGEDTELRELFEEEEDVESSEGHNERHTKRRLRPKVRRSEDSKIPNSKNVQNEKNLEALESRIKDIKEEVQSWAQVLSAQWPEAEWKAIDTEVSSMSPVPPQGEATELTVDKIQEDLIQRLDRLQIHSHLLGSSSQALSLLIKDRQDKLSQDFTSTIKHNGPEIDPKALLKGLSKSIAQ
ncbi:hypothetical protein HG536_0C04240 [Torulaspora globosa]|uniref:Kinetochore-associated protein DSN1 n=1 Tax=Torulaspora globosa TaxID=48254 RepID=A0A7G3ZFG9_9SACH|nr:uncharacterized protein HG536_0C04240 [Torulaspora globosa]QLL32255.1 hypothetical protein HG536_0C04240 [Torulaspora globosa]